MKINNLNRSGYLQGKTNTNIENKGYENLKREGTLKITSIDGKNMNVFYRHGEALDGNIKIYTDKSNGNIALVGKERIKAEDIQYFKEDLSSIIQRAKILNERSNIGEDVLGVEFRLFSMEEDFEFNIENIEEGFIKETFLDRERVELDDKLEEFLEIKTLVDKERIKNRVRPKIDRELVLLTENIGKEDFKIEDVKTARDLFEDVKEEIYEDKILISQIHKNMSRSKGFELLR